MQMTIITGLFLILWVLGLILGVYVITLLIKALKTYLSSNKLTAEKKELIKSLSENIKQCRNDKKMTQEYVAESLGVSRQSVSKWENGTSDPSTSNLIALSELFGVAVQDLIGR